MCIYPDLNAFLSCSDYSAERTADGSLRKQGAKWPSLHPREGRCTVRLEKNPRCRESLAPIEHDSLGNGAEERGDLGVNTAAGGRTGERLVCDQQVIHTSLKISSFQGLMMIIGTQKFPFRPYLHREIKRITYWRKPCPGLPSHLRRSPTEVIIKAFRRPETSCLETTVSPSPLEEDLATGRMCQNIPFQSLEILQNLLVLVSGIPGWIGALVLKEGEIIAPEINCRAGFLIFKMTPESVATCEELPDTDVKSLAPSYFPEHHVRIMDISERVADAQNLNLARIFRSFRQLKPL